MVPLPVGLFDDPSGHAVCLGLSALAAVAAWRARRPQARACLAICAVVVGFTSPWLARLNQAWFGAFPTIDKEGSLLFFLDGVHRRLYLNPLQAPMDDAIRLIGVHAGHLWVTELFATVLTPMGAFNLQWLASAALAWWAASWAIATILDERPQLAEARMDLATFAAAFPFAMGLHFFRDLDVTTVEKGGVAFVALFVGCWFRATREGGRWHLVLAFCYCLMALYNLYFAMACAAFGALHGCTRLLGHSRPALRHLGFAVLACALPGVLIAGAQLFIQAGGPAVASPERFLWERAALDGVTLWPPEWNRLEAWRACNPVAVLVAAWGGCTLRGTRRLRAGLFIGAMLLFVSIGPVLLPSPALDAPRLTNPVYMALHHVVPGFWRVAKPEVFFQPVWLLVLAASAAGLRSLLHRNRTLGWFMVTLIFAAWWPLVRSHRDFPGLSAPIESQLNPAWRDGVFAPGDTKP